jgi:hypothetical protein
MTDHVQQAKLSQNEAQDRARLDNFVLSPDLEKIIHKINSLLINLCFNRLGNVYKLHDLLEEEHQKALQLSVGKYRDKTTFWISLAGVGLQGISAFAMLAPQVLPEIATSINTHSPFGRLINLTRFIQANESGDRVYNYNQIAGVAEKVLNIPAHFVDPFKQLYEASLQGDKTEAQAEVERLQSYLGQKRQETTQEISKLEEALKAARERLRQEEQAREAMIR